MFLTENHKKNIVEAIKKAELRTSGEIKIHIEQSNPKASVEERTVEMFHVLNMHETKERNGVIIYVAVENRQFAIFGDEGIYNAVPANFWDSTKDIIREAFKKSNFDEGLIAGITLAGEQLSKFFPYQANDTNELSDEISFS